MKDILIAVEEFLDLRIPEGKNYFDCWQGVFIRNRIEELIKRIPRKKGESIKEWVGRGLLELEDIEAREEAWQEDLTIAYEERV